MKHKVKHKKPSHHKVKHKKPSHHGHPRHWGTVIKNWGNQPFRASWTKRFRRLFQAERKYMERRQKEIAKEKAS